MKCEPDAEECVNDTYLAAWNAIPPERPDPLRTYIFRIPAISLPQNTTQILH
ncbi:sigma factor [Faecalibacterium taiwanense]|uniref:sigma factor n=1 Tax=Faecalibacterium taiwanense TaxID=3030638 RepID=UPI003AAB5603